MGDPLELDNILLMISMCGMGFPRHIHHTHTCALSEMGLVIIGRLTHPTGMLKLFDLTPVKTTPIKLVILNPNPSIETPPIGLRSAILNEIQSFSRLIMVSELGSTGEQDITHPNESKRDMRFRTKKQQISETKRNPKNNKILGGPKNKSYR